MPATLPRSPAVRLSLPKRWLSNALVWAGFLVLLLSLPRFLVVCVGPHCERRIELLHASGSCCLHHHGVEPGGGSEAPECTDQHACTDFLLGLGGGPVPKAPSKGFEHEPYLGLVATVATSTLPAPPEVELRPPSTGPPRTDARTALLSTTVLRL